MSDDQPRREVVVEGRRVFGPKSADHYSIGQPCPACRVPFAEGDDTVLIPLGPGDDLHARERAAMGRAYDAVAVEVHAACAGVIA